MIWVLEASGLPNRPLAPAKLIAAQAHGGEAVGDRLVADEVIRGRLRTPVGVRRRRRGLFRDGHLFGFPVDRGRRGERQALYARRAHRLEQPEGAAEVVPVVAARLLDGLRDRRERGEVQDAVEPLAEDAAEPPLVEQTAPREPRLFGARLYPFERLSRTTVSCPDWTSRWATTLPM